MIKIDKLIGNVEEMEDWNQTNSWMNEVSQARTTGETSRDKKQSVN